MLNFYIMRFFANTFIKKQYKYISLFYNNITIMSSIPRKKTIKKSICFFCEKIFFRGILHGSGLYFLEQNYNLHTALLYYAVNSYVKI